MPEVLVHVLRHLQLQGPVPRRGDDAFSENVRRDLIERGRQTQQLVGRLAVEDLHGLHMRRAHSERSSLVEYQRAHPCERLQRASALDDHTSVGRT
jgi:hypothetical protein